MKVKIIPLLFISLTAEIFSATITSTHRYWHYLEVGEPVYSEGAGPSFVLVLITKKNRHRFLDDGLSFGV